MIELPWQANRSRQEQGGVTERRMAKARGARVHPRSGAGKIKSDASTDTELLEYKDANKSYSLRGDELLTLLKYAVRQGKEPVFVIYFTDADVTAEIKVMRGQAHG
jgi:hypothetical protein